jgi:hypothetical protein
VPLGAMTAIFTVPLDVSSEACKLFRHADFSRAPKQWQHL